MKKKAFIAAVCGLSALLVLLAVWNAGNQTDFTGQARLRYRQDVAYSYCRRLEREIGMQIFYLPEWTEMDQGLLHYSDFDRITLDKAYFQAVLEELQKMQAAYSLYPDGFLQELTEKKGRRTEIILCPYTYQGYANYGLYVHDYRETAVKTDQIYYTGIGDSQYYSHEMGHMVLVAAAMENGWQETVDAWDQLGGYVSAYAKTSRPEDWAETWAWLWHRSGEVAAACQGDEALREKVRYLTKLLADNYAAILPSQLPWTAILYREGELP